MARKRLYDDPTDNDRSRTDAAIGQGPRLSTTGFAVAATCVVLTTLVIKQTATPIVAHWKSATNAARHRIAMTQARLHPPARELKQFRQLNGDGGMDALRILKGRLSGSGGARPSAPPPVSIAPLPVGVPVGFGFAGNCCMPPVDGR
jgi:hypothetical protein